MTNFGGDNPIGGSGGASQPPQAFPPPPPFAPGPSSGSGGFGGGFANQPPGPAGPAPFSGGGYPNAPGNAPFPGGGPSFGSPSFEPPSYSSAPPKNRRKLFGLVVGAVVLVVAVVVGIIVVVDGSSSDATTASGAVKGYLKALAKGDADKALSFGINEPPDKTYLTDEVLKQQLAKMPITDIQILGEDGNTVHVLAKFGDQPVDEEIPVKKSGDGSYKVEYVTYALNFGKEKAQGSTALLDSFSIFGKPVPSSGIAYLFPGAIEVSNSNPNITLKYRRDSYLQSGATYKQPEEDADYELEVSEEGKNAAGKAILDAMTECAKSTSLAPPKCPMDGDIKYGLIEGSARWTAPTNTDKVMLRMPSTLYGKALSGHAIVSGAVDFTLSAQSTEPMFNVNNENMRVIMDGYVDLTKNPPTYTYERDH
ncbi:hypothetical protein M2272_004639 [Mycobacterium frederiksbergense]|uniref:DUF2993 domain-containing protein n=1 Tax=Mycolicibacterium frederiksbergense TaxID=117567 RepID=A0ABT6L4V5_9MYCO|nr:hypothetical protein [Mycolicibacterium frederiksbergense]MDH6197983.1 hypothetical protein [Mycolicibacterium frederiksbergense]